MAGLAGIEFLSSLKPWNGKGGFGLESVLEAARRWGSPQDAVPSIHVAGTNGKGSVATLVASCLGAGGARVGLTTSPHLTRVNERIVIDGLAIDNCKLDRAALELRELLSPDGLELSFFEAITLIFFAICRDEQLDFMVVEVGLGGRLDATNIISAPLAGAIVSIGLDHTDILGESEAEIAREKAGIIKPGMTVVSGELSDQALNEVRVAAHRVGAAHLHFNRDFRLEKLDASTVRGSLRDGQSVVLRPQLQGIHQLKNSAVAAQIAAIVGVDKESIQTGIESAKWPGRLEMIEFGGRAWLLDAGHNPHGIRTLVDFIQNKSFQDITFIFGAINTKDWKEMISLLMPFGGRWLVLTAHSSAAVPSAHIVEFLSSHGVSAESFGTDYSGCISRAIEWTDAPPSSANGNSDPLSPSPVAPIIVVGSIYMLGAVRRLLGVEESPLWSRRC